MTLIQKPRQQTAKGKKMLVFVYKCDGADCDCVTPEQERTGAPPGWSTLTLNTSIPDPTPNMLSHSVALEEKHFCLLCTVDIAHLIGDRGWRVDGANYAANPFRVPPSFDAPKEPA